MISDTDHELESLKLSRQKNSFTTACPWYPIRNCAVGATNSKTMTETADWIWLWLACRVSSCCAGLVASWTQKITKWERLAWVRQGCIWEDYFSTNAWRPNVVKNPGKGWSRTSYGPGFFTTFGFWAQTICVMTSYSKPEHPPDHSWIKLYVNIQVDWSGGPLKRL